MFTFYHVYCPFSIITDNIILGTYPSKDNVPILIKNNVKFILTLDTVPLDQSIFSDFTLKYFNVMDEEFQDMLGIFDEAFDFIDKSSSMGAIYVHWFVCAYFTISTAGVSRSATIVIGYLMMKRSLSFKDAFEFVVSKRYCVNPNIGFVHQLKMFETMKWKVDKDSNIYRQYAIRNVALGVVKQSNLD
ncbi:unnamed protein product [Protopolystoma xenopodis]|uniref:protein-tyrosine-phosphatase n=1 Tax=Protopolystoma xenopodis TaxID=117903 RepID=A0A448WM02_9PLAT|nr:unnamed protein product [Protopolystoma xenopodis]